MRQILSGRFPTESWPARSTINTILDRHGKLHKQRRQRKWAHPGAAALVTERPNQVWPALGKIFTYFFVMLGPVKLLGPFVRITRGMDAATSRTLALKGFGIACVAGLIAATVGQNTLAKWGC